MFRRTGSGTIWAEIGFMDVEPSVAAPVWAKLRKKKNEKSAEVKKSALRAILKSAKIHVLILHNHFEVFIHSVLAYDVGIKDLKIWEPAQNLLFGVMLK